MKNQSPLSLFMLCVSLSILTGCRESRSSPSVIIYPTVETKTLTKQSGYEINRVFIGQVQSRQQTQIASEIGGKITRIWVESGAHVKKNDPLLSIDTQYLQLEAERLQAQKQQLNAELTLVELNLTRQQRLKRKGYAADAQIDQLTTEQSALQAQLAQLKTALAQNRLQEDKATLKAPYNGVIASRLVSIGDVINVGAPTFTLLSPIREAHVGVPHKHLSAFPTNTKVTLHIGDTAYDSRVLQVPTHVQTPSRNALLRFSLPRDTALLDGQLVRIHHKILKPQQGYWLPIEALLQGEKNTWQVYLATPEEKHHRLSRHNVAVHHLTETQAFVSANWQENAILVSRGVHRLANGQLVTLSSL